MEPDTKLPDVCAQLYCISTLEEGLNRITLHRNMSLESSTQDIMETYF